MQSENLNILLDEVRALQASAVKTDLGTKSSCIIGRQRILFKADIGLERTEETLITIHKINILSYSGD